MARRRRIWSDSRRRPGRGSFYAAIRRISATRRSGRDRRMPVRAATIGATSNARRWRSRLGAGASWRFENADLGGDAAAPVWLPEVRPDVLHVTVYAPWRGEIGEPLPLAG